MGRVNENENRSKISISAESREEADQLFKGLSWGTIEVPIGESLEFLFWYVQRPIWN
jgi:PhnB protein